MFNPNILISEKVSKMGLIIFLFLYIGVTILLISSNSNIVMIYYVFGSLFLYLIKPSISFVFTLLALIEPIGWISYGRIAILFLILTLISIFLNFKQIKNLIKDDKYFKLVLGNVVLFIIYQLIFTFKETDGSSYTIYILTNIKSIFGVLVIIPAYYFAITDRKNFFLSILILSMLTLFYFYLSKSGMYQIFNIVESDRGLDVDITRIDIDFDIRILVKIFAYLLPAFFLWDLELKSIRRIIIFDGILSFGILFIMLLRLELFYTALGSLLPIYFLRKNFRIDNISFKYLQLIFIFIFLVIIFYDQFKAVTETFLATSKYVSGTADDSSANTRLEWIPLMLVYFINSPIFGAGNYLLSFDNLGEYAAADVQILGALSIYGIVGIVIYIFRYYLIFKAFRQLGINIEVFKKYRIEVICLYGIVCFFITAILFKLFAIFGELIYGWMYVEFSVLTGVLFGLIRFINIKSTNIDLELNES